jgi:FeS assembly SUF system protein
LRTFIRFFAGVGNSKMWYITNRKGDIRLDKEKCKERIMEQLEEVNDPELNIDIVNLGLVYGVDIDDDGRVQVTMTLTAMGCPLAGTIEQQVRDAVQKVDGVTDVQVDIVWNPPWDKSRMSRLAKIALGIHDG